MRTIKWQLVKKIVHWLLLIVTVIFLISGFGITEFRIVESLTFGLLTKPLAFKIHENLWIPFILLMGLHIFLSLVIRKVRLRKITKKEKRVPSPKYICDIVESYYATGY